MMAYEAGCNEEDSFRHRRDRPIETNKVEEREEYSQGSRQSIRIPFRYVP